MRPFYKLLIAGFKQFLRDKTALFFTFGFPILFMLIFGLVFSGSGNVSYDVGLVNNDNSPVGTAISQAVRQVPVFKVSEGELDEQLQEFKNGGLRAVIVIPPDVQAKIDSGSPADITVYYDPSQTTTSQIVLSILQELLNQVDRQLTNAPVLLQLSEESIQSRRLSDIDYLVPGILGMSVLFLGLFGALPMVEWREKKVLKRFGATPLPRSIVVSSQVAYRLVLAVIQMLLIIAVAQLIFGVNISGSWLVLLGLVLLGTLTFVSIGYLAVSRSRSVEGAMPIVQLIQFPMLFLSGIFFPVEFMPDFMRPVVNAMPLTYLGDALRQVMVEAVPLHSLLTDVAVLAGWLIVSMILAIKLFRWE